MQLQKLEINAFRGATRPFVLRFEPDKPITLIFGENGHGKTTIADALACLCTDEPGSIRDKSGADATALPSLGQDPASLSIRLHTDAGVFTARYAHKKIVKDPPTGQPPLRVIRRQHIVELANAAPADRYKHLRAYIDVEAIEKNETALRNLLRSLQSELDREAGAMSQAERTLHEAWLREGSPLGTWQDWAGEAALRDVAADAARLDQLRQTAVAARALLDAAQRHAVDRELVLQARANLDSQQAHLHTVLAGQPASSAGLLRLLQQARQFLAEHRHGENHGDTAMQCPVCGEASGATQLAARIDREIGRMTALDAATQAGEAAQREKQEAEAVARSSYAEYKRTLATLRTTIGQLPDADRTEWAPLLATEDPEALWRSAPWPALAAPLARLDERATRLDTAVKQHGIIQAQWQAIGRGFRETERLYALVQAAQSALDVVETSRKAFIEEALEAVAADINELYAALHPGEALSEIRLFLREKVKGSLDLTAGFHGHTVAPQAVYSESHLDTLALCIFLALARRYGGRECILLLDDVVMSSDHTHLQNFLNLLQRQAGRFAHIIVTTHYRPWREAFLAGQAPGAGVQFVELGPWSLERGMYIQ